MLDRQTKVVLAFAFAGAFGMVGVAHSADRPVSMPLTQVNGQNGFYVEGTANDDYLGTSVARIGDFNGDGIDDFTVTTEFGVADVGINYVVFGRAEGFPAKTDLSQLDGRQGFRIEGVSVGDGNQANAAAAGDVNHDGLMDIIVGRSTMNNNVGTACVIYGTRTVGSGHFSLGSITGKNGFCMSGGHTFDGVGYRVSSAGDFNGDGIDDVAVSAIQADPAGSESGSVYIVFGNAAARPAMLSLTSMASNVGFRVNGDQAGGMLGEDLAAAGDVNGDGLDDLIIGAETVVFDDTRRGSAYVLLGTRSRPGAVLSVANLNGSNGFRILGAPDLWWAGRSVGGGADVNGDGIADMMIGSLTSVVPGGVSWVLYGQHGNFPPVVRLEDLDGSNGFRIDGASGNDFAGEEISGLGDINGDGIDDIGVGAQHADPMGESSGAAYVVFGQRGVRAPVQSLALLDGSNGFALTGALRGNLCGWNTQPAGDINHDGGQDLLVSCHYASGAGIHRGQVFADFGTPAVTPRVGADFRYVPRYLTVQFADASVPTPAAQIMSYRWDFGDGSSADVANPVKAYAKAGTYLVRLTATDSAGVPYRTKKLVRVGNTVALGSAQQYLWLMPEAANTQQQGVVRVVNFGTMPANVTIEGLDAAGRRSQGIVYLTLAGNESRQLNSSDLEHGSIEKGLIGSLGEALGDWTIMVSTTASVEALGYIRTPDGFLTAVHDRVAGDGVDWTVPFFNPASNGNQVSHLRLVNTNSSAINVLIDGTDDAGHAGAATVSLGLAPFASVDLTAADLELGNASKGLGGALGTGQGKWRLQVSSTGRLTVQSLLFDPIGKLTNLSTIADGTQVSGKRTLWFLPSASNDHQQGFVRLINAGAAAGTVTLAGVDDAGHASSGTVHVSLPAHGAIQFTSADLEAGNPDKGLSGALGAGTGDWRLQLSSDLDLMMMGLVRTPDGFLTSLHDQVPGDGTAGTVVIFNPANNPNQVSELRIVNPNSGAATVYLQAVDDSGKAAPSGQVSLKLGAGAAVMLTATDLEKGNSSKGLSGHLGTGTGKWRLQFTAAVPVHVMSVLRDPNGYLTDLSTRAQGGSSQLDP